MTRRMDQLVGEREFDNLINNTFPPAEAFSITLRAGQGLLKRGTALALSSEEDMVILGTVADQGETLVANCILTDDIETGTGTGDGIYALAYFTGNFNRNRLLVTSGYVITPEDEENLRKGGILLNDAI